VLLNQTEAAHRQLRLAVRLFFNGGDPICVHTLACNAREIYEKTCIERGLGRFFDEVQTAFPDRSQQELWNVLNDVRNFLKHPRKPPDDTIEFHDDCNVYTLLAASHDCQNVCGDSMPIEAGVFLTWISVTHEAMSVDYIPLGISDFCLLGIDNQFPGLRKAPMEEKLRFGRELLACNLLPTHEPMGEAA
jgi:hypothetical protein